VEVWCQDLLRNFVKTSFCRFANSFDGRDPLDEPATLLLDMICSVLANLLDESDRLYRPTSLEKDHYRTQRG
jgi:hypothetical protein